VEKLAQQLSWHIAAMKPSYLYKSDVPKTMIAELTNEGPSDGRLKKYLTQEVLMEQELATSEEEIRIDELIKEKSKEIKSKIDIKEWAVFNIGS
jgi:translation elongation factor EF-Ts